MMGFDDAARRLDALERAAHEYLHEGVGPVKREEWYGWRPMMVDDVPVIGAVPGRRRQWLATGHGMLGVSMSTGTAELMADLICGRTPRIDPAPVAGAAVHPAAVAESQYACREPRAPVGPGLLVGTSYGKSS